MIPPKPPVINNPWAQLRQFTAARIALGRSGASLPTQPQLAFQLAHARARDAVHQALDVAQLLADAEAAGVSESGQTLVLHSQVADRLAYLQRPDLGRRLNDASRERLQALPKPASHAYDIAIVVVDGLSSRAVAQNAVPLLSALHRLLDKTVSLAPLTIVGQGRVAIGDEVGKLLGAKAVLLLIGERPGLSSPDSLGAYLTWAPRVGLTDAARNCISNIRPEGLPWDQAAHKVAWLVGEMQRRQLSGVGLKDETGSPDTVTGSARANFLLGRSA